MYNQDTSSGNSVIKNDLEYTSHNCFQFSFDLWEEVQDLHLYVHAPLSPLVFSNCGISALRSSPAAKHSKSAPPSPRALTTKAQPDGTPNNPARSHPSSSTPPNFASQTAPTVPTHTPTTIPSTAAGSIALFCLAFWRLGMRAMRTLGRARRLCWRVSKCMWMRLGGCIRLRVRRGRRRGRILCRLGGTLVRIRLFGDEVVTYVGVVCRGQVGWVYYGSKHDGQSLVHLHRSRSTRESPYITILV